VVDTKNLKTYSVRCIAKKNIHINKMLFKNPAIFIINGTVSTLLLLGAFFFQYILGLPPCHLCILERWPHVMMVTWCGGALWFRHRLLDTVHVFKNNLYKNILIGGILLLHTAAFCIALYHSGIEYHWWQGFSTCSSTIKGHTIKELLDSIMKAPVVRCDTILWRLGLSLAAWHTVFCAMMLIYNLIALKNNNTIKEC
jgi:disulfide bond formation protein DsbB